MLPIEREEILEITGSADALPEQVYIYLKRHILDGTLPSNSRVTETEICQALDVSRTPVHQAAVRLEAEHLVQILPKKGLVIMDIDPRGILDMYDIAEVLEGKAAWLAASNCSSYYMHLMEHYCEMFEQQNPPVVDYKNQKLNMEFHMIIADASGNEMLASYIKTIRERLSMVRFSKFFKASETTVPAALNSKSEFSHAMIVAAIKKHDCDKAEFLMRKHINLAKNRILNNIIH